MRVGDIVLYTINAFDAEAINRRRTTTFEIRNRIAEEKWPLGAQAHIGWRAEAGQKFPMMVVATAGAAASGQVFLLGNDVLFVFNVIRGDRPGQWQLREDPGANRPEGPVA